MSEMRLDLFLSKVGLVKRRTVAKELADNGRIKINGNAAKAGKEVRAGDIIQIGGNRPVNAEILKIPSGSVRKENRSDYFRILDQ